MNSILITGCNRGLGLGLIKCLTNLQKPPKHIFATCRNIDQAEDLKKLSEKCSNLHIIQADLTDFDSYDRIFNEVNNVIKDSGLNVLFNNAGISRKSTRINFTHANDLIDSFVTNTVAPIMLAKTFLPLLKKAADVNRAESMGVKKAVIVNMSSILGSIQSNVEGGLYAYRVTKSGLNAATKSLSIDLKGNGIMSVSLHPGWVKTDMGGSKAPLDIETSCSEMINLIMNLNESHNGGFVQYDGKTLPW